jgi:ketosteroid isomerase-like protein
VAFSHGLARVSGSLKIGETDYWVRRTTRFRKIDGKWLIIHEHISLPVGSTPTAIRITDDG